MTAEPLSPTTSSSRYRATQNTGYPGHKAHHRMGRGWIGGSQRQPGCASQREAALRPVKPE